jgi:Fe-S-cluster-containing dehydrogenase component/CRP-like cAMP-binding protein
VPFVLFCGIKICMPREITDLSRVVKAVENLPLTAELFKEENGKGKRDGDLDVYVQKKEYNNGKLVGPYFRLFSYDSGEEITREGEWGGNTFYVAIEGTLDVYIGEGENRKKVNQLEPGTSFGEMSVLAGVERNATVSVPANQTAVVLEVARPALRLLRKLQKFSDALVATYRKHGISHVVDELAQLIDKPVGEQLIQELRNSAQYMVYGKHHVLCQEGEPIDRLILIKDGWVRRARGISFDATTPEVVIGIDEGIGVDFLGPGNCLGLEGVQQPEKWKYNATLLARTEVLEIPLATFPSQLREQLFTTFSAFSNADDSLPQTVESIPDLNVLKSVEEEITTGIIDGTNVLVMDMDLCVRCGNCSLACHKVHGQSRLLRRGIQIERPVPIGNKRLQHALIPQVCLHCSDPECLTGCPTGSISRNPLGHIDIDPQTCIGCWDCAKECPYNAISMVPRETPPEESGLLWKLTKAFRFKSDVPAEPVMEKDMLAVKCNLCEDTPLNPPGARRKAYSCEENCPTGALVRIRPLEYFTEAGALQGFVFKDQTHAIGRNIHKSDPLARAWHVGGVLFGLFISAAVIWGLWKYGFDGVLARGWLTMRWLTGLVGLFGIVVVMAYHVRKKIYRRRAGALRYWLLAHSYIGVTAGIVLLLHAGRQSGGLLTTLLYIAFDLVILSGLVGIITYVVAPKIMTRIEGDPLLVEDLEVRRDELQQQAESILQQSQGWLKDEIKNKVYPRFLSLRFLWRQISRREELRTLLAEAREHFKERTTRLATGEERDLLISAVETAVTLRRVQALLLLHWLLRFWIPMHVVSTAVMLALMVVHIGQVVFFSVK